MRQIITDTLLGPEDTGDRTSRASFLRTTRFFYLAGVGSKGNCPNFENCIVDASILINSCLLEIK